VIPLEEFHPFILPFVPDCPIPFLDFQLALAARELCERTNAWRTVDSFTSSGGAGESFAIPPNSSVHEIEFVHFDGYPLSPLQFREASQYLETGSPVGYTQIEANTISLIPAGVGSVVVSAVLKPVSGADSFPDFLLDQYPQEMTDGTLAKILMIPGQPWSDPQRGLMHRASFNAAVDKAFTAGVRGQQRAPVRTRSSFL